MTVVISALFATVIAFIPKSVALASDSGVDTFKTNRGVVFEKVEFRGFGPSWRTPDGRVWSRHIGNFSNIGTLDASRRIVGSAATKACQRHGGHLPTVQDFQHLYQFFHLEDAGIVTKKDWEDFLTLFGGSWERPGDIPLFWTASGYTWSATRTRSIAWWPHGKFDPVREEKELAVRCVSEHCNIYQNGICPEVR